MPSAIFNTQEERNADLRGYGATPPPANWPNNAKLALSFVLNIEEGSERNILDGDKEAESLNSDMICQPWPGLRNLVMESHYEYGSRSGVWRILDTFSERNIPITAFAIAQAMERTPEIAHRLVEDGHEIAAHGWRWLDYRDVDPDTERDHIKKTIKSLQTLCGDRPLGWYTGRVSAMTRKLIIQEGGFLYDSDNYNDDLPYWIKHETGKHLVLPYAFDTNDMRFASSPGFDTGNDYYEYLKDTFDYLYREGVCKPKMMSVGLHCRLAGRPGRMMAFEKFLDHVAKHDDVWIAKRIDIAKHWIQEHDCES